MEAPQIRAIPPSPAVQRVPADRRGAGGGGFERAFERERRDRRDGGLEDASEVPAPPDLQAGRPAIRRDHNEGDHRIDVVV